MEDHAHWSQEEAEQFFEAFQASGTDWPRVSYSAKIDSGKGRIVSYSGIPPDTRICVQQVAAAIQSKTPEACEVLYKKFKSFLSLPKPLLNGTAFLAVVKDSLKMESSEADTISDMQNAKESPSSVALDYESEDAGNGLTDEQPLRRSRRVPPKRQPSQVKP